MNEAIAQTPEPSIVAATSAIVAAYLANTHNNMNAENVGDLIKSTFGALSGLGGNVEVSETAPAIEMAEDRKPSRAEIKKSIQPDHLVCFLDGEKKRTLKRYLSRAYNLTPEQYRERFGLPADYPMTAPEYSERRRALALSIGLGTKGGKRKADPKAAEALADLTDSTVEEIKQEVDAKPSDNEPKQRRTRTKKATEAAPKARAKKEEVAA